MGKRGPINDYDLGRPLKVGPLEERRANIPAPVWEALLGVKKLAQELMGTRVSLVRLYGSYARNEQHEDSDVDVLVLVDDLTPAEFDRLHAAMWSAHWPDLMMSPLCMSTQAFQKLRDREMLFAQDVDLQGITV